MGKKKKTNRNNKHTSAQPNKAKQVQQLQKQQQQQVSAAAAAGGPKAGRNKKAAFKSSSQVLASSLVNGGGAARGNAATGSGSTALPWEPKRHLPTRGLVNVGNTCFFNSILQNIFKVRLLHQSLFADDSGRRGGEYVGPVTKAFRKVLLEMKGEGAVGGRRGAYNPKALLTAVQRAHPSFRGYYQHDAHELFMRLLGTLEDEEDSCIRRRREEELEAEEEDEDEERQGREETDAVIGEEGEEVEGATGHPEGRSGNEKADVDGGPRVGMNGRDSSNDEAGSGDVVVSNVVDDTPGGESGVGGDGIEIPGAQENAATAVLVHGAKEATCPGVPSIPQTKSPNVSAGLLRVDDSATVTVTSGVACAENGNDTGAIPTAGAEQTQVAEATCTSKDTQAGLSEAGRTPNKTNAGSASSAPAYGKDESREPQVQVCGCGGADVDAGTSTDDGETTDAGDHDDDEDDNNRSPGAKGASALAPRGKPVDPSAEAAEVGVSTGGADVTGKEDKAGIQDAGHAATNAPRVPGGPQCAAVTEVFGGRLCSVVTCVSCGGRSFCTEPMVCLSLEIPFKAKAPSEKGLAYIARKKAAAAAAAAAAAEVESAPAESVASGLKLSSDPANGEVGDTPGTDPTMAEGHTNESDGFVLSVSAKQKKKAARQERDRQRLANADKRVGKRNERQEADATGVPVTESSGDKNHNTKLLAEGRGVGRRAPQDGGDEVRQCLEHILSACVSAAAGAVGVGGESESMDATAAPGVDPNLAAAKHTADECGIAGLERHEGEDTPEALLPGFRLSTKERKKIARQEKNERQRTMEANANAWAEGNEKAAPQSPPGDVNKSHDAGGNKFGGAAAASAGSEVEPASQSKAPCGKERSDEPARVSAGAGEGRGEAAQAHADEACGESSVKRGETPVSRVAADFAVPGPESLPSFDNKGTSADGEAQRSGARAAAPCEVFDSEAQSCAGDPAPEGDSAAVKVSGKVERGDETERQTGDASGRREQQPPDVELRNRKEEVSDESPFSSSGSLTGCTTGETQGSTGPDEDDRSAFGSECTEGNADGNESDEHCEEGARLTIADGAGKRLESSDVSQAQGGGKTGETSPAVDPDSAPTCLDECAVAAEGDDVAVERVGDRPSTNADAMAERSGRDVRRDGTNSDEDSGGTRNEDSSYCVPPAPAVAAAVAVVPQSPLNRLHEPPPRAKPDRRYDPIGVDLYECLDHFMAEEELIAKDGNGYDCETCTSRSRPAAAAAAGSGDGDGDGDGDDDNSKGNGKGGAPRSQQNAHKRLLMLGRPPRMLVCHLKRLQAKKKVIRSVEFPIELNMAPYFWLDPNAPLTPEQTRYRLTGLIQHRGRRDSGHFVAYVRHGDEWKHASDSAIRTASLPEVKACEAYMLFYECFGGEDLIATPGEKGRVNGSGAAAAATAAPVVTGTKVVLNTVESNGGALDVEVETGTAAEGKGELKGETEIGQEEEEEEEEEKHVSAEEGHELEAEGTTHTAHESQGRAAVGGTAGGEPPKAAKTISDEKVVEVKSEAAYGIEGEAGVARTSI